MNALLESTKLATFSRQDGDGTVFVVGTVKVFVALVLHGSPEERLARAATQRTEMVGLGDIAADQADFVFRLASLVFYRRIRLVGRVDVPSRRRLVG